MQCYLLLDWKYNIKKWYFVVLSVWSLESIKYYVALILWTLWNISETKSVYIKLISIESLKMKQVANSSHL